MRIHRRIPAAACRNADVFGRSQLDPGERVVDLEINIENMGREGHLVLRERTVVSMAKKLKYHIVPAAQHEADMATINDELERLRDIERRYDQITEALATS